MSKKQYRYLPADNKTPLMHPTIGHLVYDGVYSHPDCANDPRFVEITEPKVEPDPEQKAVEPAEAEANEPSASRTRAGKTGRS